MDMSSLFDDYGRCLPQGTTSQVHAQIRRYYEIKQPELDYATVFSRIRSNFGKSTQLTIDLFAKKIKAIQTNLESSAATRNITQGIMVPFFIPRLSFTDIGETLETLFIPTVGKSYAQKFPDYQFVSHIVGSLKGLLTVAAGSRHDKLLQRLTQEDVVGIYFPCLLEYSVPATREIIANLPKEFLLSGGFDTVAAIIGSPDLLFNKEKYTPLLWFSGLEAEKHTIGYHFEAYGYNLTFNRKGHFGNVSEYWNSGLTVLSD
ncbi:MAG: hypothetical protein A3F18_02730 [Legionellales bacterium RIFCSPHIGHO2_12_FULL_37_14]|nr:MAG: hypothetical protein A3F18_02730 [Legionellales bacterium RIFCSPHIGHO2_12_FULL_37_14]